ncbi:hypothetical protein [Ferrovibrio sp.]|uniref:hypothetical protein n=1 Tax=Ferrovibrio sp. TaxID=1917215 RepID=UPI0025BC7950|nr:hypothetical protein [Ferrovibrio sp.]
MNHKTKAVRTNQTTQQEKHMKVICLATVIVLASAAVHATEKKAGDQPTASTEQASSQSDAVKPPTRAVTVMPLEPVSIHSTAGAPNSTGGKGKIPVGPDADALQNNAQGK